MKSRIHCETTGRTLCEFDAEKGKTEGLFSVGITDGEFAYQVCNAEGVYETKNSIRFPSGNTRASLAHGKIKFWKVG